MSVLTASGEVEYEKITNEIVEINSYKVDCKKLPNYIKKLKTNILLNGDFLPISIEELCFTGENLITSWTPNLKILKHICLDNPGIYPNSLEELYINLEYVNRINNIINVPNNVKKFSLVYDDYHCYYLKVELPINLIEFRFLGSPNGHEIFLENDFSKLERCRIFHIEMNLFNSINLPPNLEELNIYLSASIIESLDGIKLFEFSLYKHLYQEKSHKKLYKKIIFLLRNVLPKTLKKLIILETYYKTL